MRGAGKAGSAAALAAALLLAACATPPLAVLEPRPSPGLDRSSWVLRWQEEFDGTELDPAIWRILPGPVGGGAASAKGTVRLDGEGHLLLSTRLLGGRVETAALAGGGALRQRYGYFECRLRAQASDLAHAVFRLRFSETPSTRGSSEAFAEVIAATRPAEGLGLQAYRAPGGRGSRRIRVPGMAEAFHSYGLAWSPSGLIFYVDGVETFRSSVPLPSGLASVELAMESDAGELAAIGGQAGFHADCLFDYVRVYVPRGGQP